MPSSIIKLLYEDIFLKDNFHGLVNAKTKSHTQKIIYELGIQKFEIIFFKSFVLTTGQRLQLSDSSQIDLKKLKRLCKYNCTITLLTQTFTRKMMQVIQYKNPKLSTNGI